MVDELRQEFVSESEAPASIGEKATPGLRIVAAVSFDLVIVPFFIGFFAGLILFNAPDLLRVSVLVLLNVVWVVGKDLNNSFLSLGKRLVGIKVVSATTGQAITIQQAFIRNLLLIVPGILFFGYPVELFMLIFKGERLGDKWAKTVVIKK